jgi:hypothetical protein
MMNGMPRQTSAATTEAKASPGSPSQICGCSRERHVQRAEDWLDLVGMEDRLLDGLDDVVAADIGPDRGRQRVGARILRHLTW